MTRPLQKNRERLFVEETAKRLGKSWNVGPDREHPDFLVTESEHQFGLEVCEIFTGQESTNGSVNKKGESDRQRMINEVQRAYEAIEGIPLTVKFCGDLCTENMAEIIPALVARNLVSEPVGHHVIIDIDTKLRAGLRIHVTRAFVSEWISVLDRAGWVDRNPMPRIVAIVGRKSRELPRYKRTAGLDVRLLIVANRIHNSGKLVLEGQASIDKMGFQEIYFLSYPRAAVQFG